MKPGGVRRSAGTLWFFDVGTHRICLQLCKEIPEFLVIFSQLAVRRLTEIAGVCFFSVYQQHGRANLAAVTVDAETLKEMTTVNDDVSELATGDNEQETQQENAEDDENASNEDKATNPPTEQENGENGANTEPDKATEEQQENKVIIPQGKMRVTVICDGSLNIRRSAAWGNDNICGRAIRGQSYYVKEIHIVDGKKMVRTIGDLYLSGESEHVQFEQL